MDGHEIYRNYSKYLPLNYYYQLSLFITKYVLLLHKNYKYCYKSKLTFIDVCIIPLFCMEKKTRLSKMVKFAGMFGVVNLQKMAPE